jgi:hypothetical protein
MWWNRHLAALPLLLGCGGGTHSSAEIDAADAPAADAVIVPRIVASNTVTRADLVDGIAPLVVPSGKTYVIDTDHGSMYDASNANAPIRIAGSGVQDGVFYRADDKNRSFFAVQSLSVEDNAVVRGVGGRACVGVGVCWAG